MNQIARVGVDLAKHVLQVHGVDAVEEVVVNRACRAASSLSGVPISIDQLAALLPWRQVPARSPGAASCSRRSWAREAFRPSWSRHTDYKGEAARTTPTTQQHPLRQSGTAPRRCGCRDS